jgi:hypothetical protein
MYANRFAISEDINVREKKAEKILKYKYPVPWS